MDANSFLMGGGSSSAKFEHVGASVTGRIARNPEVRQQTDLTTGDPKTWPSGDPKMQLIVALQTSYRDPAIADDDGIRSVYIKGKSLTEAVRDAVKKSGAGGLETGGTLTVTYVADGEVTKRGFNPPKQYSADYQPPATKKANDWLLSGSGNASPPAPSTTKPATQAAPQGIDPAVWSGLSATQRQALLAAGGQEALPPF